LVDGSFVEQVTSRTKNRQTDLSYEISADGRYALAQFTIQREGQSAVITRFYINGLPGSAASLNRFTLAGKSTAQYTVLLLALAAVAVTIAALVRVWRRGRFRRRWLWTIGCLIGVTATSVNWSTGQISFQPIYVELLSAGFTKAGLGPWIISVGIPVIALYVLLFRRGAEYEQPREEDA
jgi:hypothetical protein